MIVEVNVLVDNLQPLIDALMQVPMSARKGIEDAIFSIRRKVIDRTPIGATGNLKRAWSGVEYAAGGLSFGDSTYQFGNPLHYAEIIERGLFKRIGPRTIEVDGGIYSRQAPGGMIRPIIEDKAVLEAVAQQFIDAITRELERRLQQNAPA